MPVYILDYGAKLPGNLAADTVVVTLFYDVATDDHIATCDMGGVRFAEAGATKQEALQKLAAILPDEIGAEVPRE